MGNWLRGSFNLEDVSGLKDLHLFFFHVRWQGSKILYEGVSCNLPGRKYNQKLGYKTLSRSELRKISENIIDEVETLNNYMENTIEFSNRLEEARASASEFADIILSDNASEFLFQSLSTQNSVVVLISDEDLKGVPWELCHLDSEDRMGFINELGRFERSITQSRESDPYSEQAGVINFIIDKELTTDETQSKILNNRLAQLGIKGTYIPAIRECRKIFKESECIVYLGHHSPDGIRFKDGVVYGHKMLKIHPFKSNGICVLASCRSLPEGNTRIVDISQHNLLPTGISDKCGCNVIYALIKIPFERGLDIATNCYKALADTKNLTLWDAWEEVKDKLKTPYLLFFSIHGIWSKELNRQESKQ